MLISKVPGVIMAAVLSSGAVLGQGTTAITSANWGSVTTPVYGSFQAGTYGGAELFAGPNQFGYYYAGVLPNGRKVTPAGFATVQVGMNPVASALTPDTHYLIVANSTERQSGYLSYQSAINSGGYSLTVIDNTTLTVVSQYSASGSVFVGLLATGTGPYTIYAGGGADSNVKIFTLTAGTIAPATPATISIPPYLAGNAGYASNYSPAASAALFAANGYLAAGAQATFPAGMQFSPDGRFLYVACQADNSIAVIDTYQNQVVKQVAAGYFPYGVAVSFDGRRVYATNWGVNAYLFENASYDATGKLASLAPALGNEPDGFYVPKAALLGMGTNLLSSSVSQFNAPSGDPYFLTPAGAIASSAALDDQNQVGGTHPSAVVTVRNAATGVEMLYYAKSNSDSLGVVRLDQYGVQPDFDLSPVGITLAGGHKVHGGYPSALVASPDASKLYVAESGMNSVAVLDITRPTSPVLLGRIATGWYPTSRTLTSDGQYLFITNAKGIGEDVNPATGSMPSDAATDSNSMFGMVQVVYVGGAALDNTTVLANNYGFHAPVDTSVVPGGGLASALVRHVFVIIHENKTFDSVLGGMPQFFGSYASQMFQTRAGSNYFNSQFAGAMPNLQSLARNFATAVNFYSDAEESNAGAQYLGAGIATDFTEKTLLTAHGRGLLANRNAEAEDYPEGGYIFNNAARNGVSFKNYGFLTAIAGSDNGASGAGDDPASGMAGLPQLQVDHSTVTSPLVNVGDVTSPVKGLGQQYYLALPALAVLGEKNASGEARIDMNYPGVNFNISDQRRAQEFIQDFDRMVAAGTLPKLIYIYQPNDAGGALQAANAAGIVTNAAAQLAADGDTALGMVVSHIMNSAVYYDPQSNTGSAIFVTFASSQGAVDHIHPHRNLLVTVSPFAKTGYVATRHYSTASVVKTAELLLGLPPNNLGDLFATDLRDMFQSTYNGVGAGNLGLTKPAISRRVRATIGQ